MQIYGKKFYPQVCNKIVAQAVLFGNTFNGKGRLSLLASSSLSLQRTITIRALGISRGARTEYQ